MIIPLEENLEKGRLPCHAYDLKPTTDHRSVINDKGWGNAEAAGRSTGRNNGKSL